MLRPVDAQVMLHRAAEVNRVTNNDGSRAETQNQAFAQSLQKVVEQEGKQVVQSNQAEKGDVDKDGGKGNKNSRQRRGKGEEEKDEKGKGGGSGGGRGMLDIRI